MPSTVITLRKGPARLVIDTQGAYIRSWQVGRHVGLYSDPSKPNRATHPCGPNFGALSLKAPKDGLYDYQGGIYSLPQHGFLRTREWTVVKHSRAEVTLALGNYPDPQNEDLFKMYPFYFRFTLSCKLTANQLHYGLAFKSLGRTAPVDLASHTYHPWEPGMTIEGLSGLQYFDAVDPKGIGRVFKGNYFGEEKDRDWHFRANSRRKFVLRYPSSRKEITLRIGADMDDMPVESAVVWTKPSEGRFICFEPVCVGVNSLNRGMAMAVPWGQTASLSFVLSMSGI